jgi:hypothetical protein
MAWLQMDHVLDIIGIGKKQQKKTLLRARVHNILSGRCSRNHHGSAKQMVKVKDSVQYVDRQSLA